jgi:hypothetical protein
MLDLPPLGNLNLHASLLPKYRGAAPIQWAIANGETVTGVTTMRIDAGLDTGDILQQKNSQSLPTTPPKLSPRAWPPSAPISWSRLYAPCKPEPFTRARKTTRKPASPRS